MRPVCVIANPHAGGGLTAKTLPVVEAALRRRGIAFRVERTHSIEHARELARETVAAGEVAAAMGGDGLLGAVAGELRGTNGVLAVIPGGRGNDFARKLGIGSDPLAACDIIAGGVVGQIDVADINGSAFLGIASAGLDSDAGDIANETRLRLGRLVYLYATLRALRAWKSAHWEVVIDAEPHSFSGYSVAVANSGVFGGGMFLAPEAQLDDGLLDVVLVHDAPKRVYLNTLPKVFSGKHITAAALEFLRGREIAFHADRPFSVHADGDPIARLPATVRVQPGALRVLTA